MKLNKLLALICFYSISAFAAPKEPIRLAVDNNYPPYQWKEKDGSFQGIEVDATRAIFEKAGIKYIFVDEPIERAFEQIKRGDNVVAVGIIKTPERLKFSNIDVTLYLAPPVVAAVNNARLAKAKAGMKFQEFLKSGLTLGVVTGYSYTSWVDDQIKDLKDADRVFRQPAQGLDELHMLVSKGRFDYTLTYPDVFKWWSDHNPEQAKNVSLLKIGDVPPVAGLSQLMFPKNVDNEMIKNLATTADSYRKSTEYKAMLKKYVAEY